jgi:hypothetical protein
MRHPVIVLLVTTGLLACGSRAVDFPVDSGKEMSTLTADELQAMCNAMKDSAKDGMEVVCLLQGVSLKFKPDGSEQACQTKVTSCLAELSAKTLDCNLVKPSMLEGCTATVGEYEKCLNDSLELATDLKSKLSCSMSLSDMMDLAQKMQAMQQMPSSCQTVVAKCPKLLSQTDIDDSPQPGSGTDDQG